MTPETKPRIDRNATLQKAARLFNKAADELRRQRPFKARLLDDVSDQVHKLSVKPRLNTADRRQLLALRDTVQYQITDQDLTMMETNAGSEAENLLEDVIIKGR